MNVSQIALCFVFFFSFSTYGQSYEDRDYYLIDSLDLSELPAADKSLIEDQLAIFHNAQHDTSKLAALEPIVQFMISDKWGSYAKYMLDYSERLLNQEGNSPEEHAFYERIYGISLSDYGMYISHHGDNKGAIKLYEKSMAISKKNNNLSGLSAVYNNLGFQYEQIGRIEESMEYHHYSLEIDLSLNDTAGITSSYNNLGLLYNNIGEYDMALDNFIKCYAYLKDEHDLMRLAITYGNLGSAYGQYGQQDSSAFYCKKALAIQEEIGDNVGMSISLGSLADNYKVMKDTVQAILHFERAIEVASEVGYSKGIATNKTALARIYLAQKKYELARELVESSYQITNEVGLLHEKSTATGILYQIYQNQGKYQSALEMHVEHTLLLDSLSNIENKTLAIKKDMELDFSQRAMADSISNAKEKEVLNIRHEEEQKKEAQRSLFLGLLFVLALIFGGFIFNRFRITRKQKVIIEEQKQTVDVAYEQLETKNREILDSIEYAKRIQSAILPPDKIIKSYLHDSFILYLPKDIVAGDFYWLENTEDTVLFAAADCTGHGVPGAMVSVVCHNAMNRSVREYGLTAPGQILDKTREIVISEFGQSEDQVHDGMDIALCSLRENRLEFSGANNPLWIIRKGDHSEGENELNRKASKVMFKDGYTLFEIAGDKQPVGKHYNTEPFQTHSLTLEKGDRIYIFSDGYLDQFGGERGKKLKSKGFKTLLIAMQELGMEEQKITIHEKFDAWKGDLEQLDDVCLIGLSV